MRRYREDNERVVKIGNHFVRRPPQAAPVPETWGEAVRRNWPEIVFGVLILLTFWLGLPFLAGIAA